MKNCWTISKEQIFIEMFLEAYLEVLEDHGILFDVSFKNKYLLAASGSCLNPNSSTQLLMCSSIGAPSFSLKKIKTHLNHDKI